MGMEGVEMLVKVAKIAMLVGGTVFTAFVATWLLQEDKSELPTHVSEKPDRSGPPGKI